MSTEDRLHRMMSNVGQSEADQNSWADFLTVAHRSHARHRALAAVAVVGVVAASIIGAAALVDRERDNRDLRPSDRNVAPVPIPEDVPSDCPTPPEFTEGALGTVAYLGATELHVVDVATGEDSILVQGGPGFGEGFFAGEVKISPDGQWVSFGEGLMVPTAGGEVCAPLGEGVQDLQWTANGHVVALGNGTLIQGGPGYETDPFRFEGQLPEFRSMVLQPFTERVAVAAFKGDSTSIWTIDLTSDEVARFQQVSSYGLAEIEIAGWDPEGRWVLYWTKFPNSESLDADGSPLSALELETEKVVTVTEAMISERDQMTWCAGRLVFSDGGGRYSQDGGKVITATEPPVWDRDGLHPSVFPGSYVDPACDETGNHLAATRAFTDGDGLSSLILWVEGTTEQTEIRPSVQLGPITGYIHPELSNDGSTVVVEGMAPVMGDGDGANELLVLSGDERRTLGILGSGSSFIQVGGSPSWDWHRRP